MYPNNPLNNNPVYPDEIKVDFAQLKEMKLKRMEYEEMNAKGRNEDCCDVEPQREKTIREEANYTKGNLLLIEELLHIMETKLYGEFENFPFGAEKNSFDDGLLGVVRDSSKSSVRAVDKLNKILSRLECNE